MGKNNARMIDSSLFEQAGIDRKTGLPIKVVTSSPSQLKRGMKLFLRLIDEQDACNRFQWIIPEGLELTSQEIERLLYYKGQLCFFKLNDKYYLMPYALTSKDNSGIDFYGRFNEVHPVPMANGSDEMSEGEKRVYKNQMEFLSRLNLKVIYSESTEINNIEECCVLLHDYTKQISQTIIARYLVNEPLLDLMACMIPYLRTCAIASTGIKGVRVQDSDQSEQINIGARDLDDSALNGKIWYPIIGSIEFQELTDKSGTKMQEYMQTLQSLNNLRLQGYGLENGGMFEKKSHMLGEEQQMNSSNTALVMKDALDIRKRFCKLVNHVFGFNIQVEQVKSDNEMSIDTSKDNYQGGNNDASNS